MVQIPREAYAYETEEEKKKTDAAQGCGHDEELIRRLISRTGKRRSEDKNNRWIAPGRN